METRPVAVLGVVLLSGALVACGPADGSGTIEGGATATATAQPDPPSPDERIDTEALLDRYGFERCDGIPPPGQITTERASEIVHAAIDAGIAGGGGGGDEGYKGTVSLYVLDEASLAALAGIADPSEVCVDGEDPNDYVPLGPQALDGPGWRWIGAGSGRLATQLTLIASQDTYDQLWMQLGEGPETGQAPVDFDRQVILAISHGNGVNFGRCGHRFDGYTVDDGVVVIDWFSPGGNTDCPAELLPATYAVALDLAVVGSPPLSVAYRYGPGRDPQDQQVVDVGSFATTTTIPVEDLPVAEPTTTTVGPVPPTAAPVTTDVDAGIASSPGWAQRAGSLTGDGFDVPVPPEWESSAAPGYARSAIVGRGELVVESFAVDDPAWRAAVNPGPDLEVTAGPTALAVPTYRAGETGTTTSGETVGAHEYRFASTTSFLTLVVRWYERGDTIVVATLGYPDPGKVPQALTGLDPAALLSDIRILAH